MLLLGNVMGNIDNNNQVAMNNNNQVAIIPPKNIRGIPKLLDANLAGTERSSECSIIVCEGDSAKAGIVSGLSSDDRNMYGVYPMKGKIKNTRGEKEVGKKGVENKELADFKKFLFS